MIVLISVIYRNEASEMPKIPQNKKKQTSPIENPYFTHYRCWPVGVCLCIFIDLRAFFSRLASASVTLLTVRLARSLVRS